MVTLRLRISTATAQHRHKEKYTEKTHAKIAFTNKCIRSLSPCAPAPLPAPLPPSFARPFSGIFCAFCAHCFSVMSAMLRYFIILPFAPVYYQLSSLLPMKRIFSSLRRFFVLSIRRERLGKHPFPWQTFKKQQQSRIVTCTE